ncbi:30S ribosomal protein S9 [Candidatus Woesearchaeota archaeon]|jgi:small subunit ribosomal protein S9|nr:30S ribosomal protein S9 [Candidatus Woesearchaeota archaeon]MBT4835563.1 30S ribosomal protein S9 [Candidatus Woesearchaeota archaeon]MBT6734947.1 30S ribosomal protein S9 [Candidatus Woesearchaeota archaeon]MBT7169756.1 30S ribosomal protein S9 [Candidatus Woesearchaeota archaeon]MBT7474420.1 30S ribosomal protein S9 [Candidatus Woesearchaeota archaeon]
MKVIHKAGKRKTAIARATMKAGKGVVRINYTTLENYEPEIAKLKITEPLLIAGKMSEKYNFQINVRGGGWQSQAEAARLAIARCLMEADGKLKDKFLEYDRNLVVADTRRKEVCKPNDSKARAKRQKSYR